MKYFLFMVVLVAVPFANAQSCDSQLAVLQQSHAQEIMNMRRNAPKTDTGQPDISACDLAQKRATQSMQMVQLAIKCNSPEKAQAALAAKNFKQDADQFCDDTSTVGKMRQNNESEFDAELLAAQKASRERGMRLAQERKQKEAAQREAQLAEQSRQQAQAYEESYDSYEEAEDDSDNRTLELILGVAKTYQDARADEKAHDRRMEELRRAEREASSYTWPSNTNSQRTNTPTKTCAGTAGGGQGIADCP